MAAKARIAGLNEGYARELYEAYRADPGSVPEDWRQFFAEGGGELVAPEAPAAPRPAAGGVDPRKAAAAVALALRIRQRGHLLARLDPLGTPPPGDPGLTIEYHGLSEDDLAALPAGLLDGPLARDARTAGDVIGRLRAVYCDRIGYDLAHVQDHDEREWWIEAVESGRYLAPLAAESRRELLRRLTVVEVFEQFLHRTFVGRTRFSIEGVDMLVPMLDTLLGLAAKAGIPTVAIGMAHRGRLNVLAHVLGKPYEDILKELMGLDPGEPFAQTEGGNLGYTGDVTYHLGRAGQLAAYPIRAILANNPSHLEFVDPVVLGVARAIQDERAEAGPGRQDVDRCLPILIHGDASFPGEGIVAETMNLSRLVGYRVGGTVHLILNNQLGYTTTPREGRSTTYASDAAGGFEIPVLHVNADDPEACLVAVRMAFDYRRRFHKDVLVDLVGYRRWGHNEGDEPSFTQPVMYRVIAEHPTVRTIWARSLVAEGVVSEDEVEAMRRAAWEALQAVRERVQAEAGAEGGADRRPGAKAEDGRAARAEATAPRAREAPATSVPLARLRRLNEEALALPAGFALHPKLERQLAHRLEVVRQGGALDWAHAELLAFASILADGTPIRLTGQDTLRGTFNQRHVAFFDYHTGQPVLPLQRMPSAKAAFMAYNSPLAEAAPLGFEYGYSTEARETLVLWEAQFGDFVNVAQVVVDQFIASGPAKWQERSGLVLLLPHGYEGMGPEHSSARLERFLQLAAEGNLRIANCTTAAQYFHLLRRQAALLATDPRPLVVLTPKSLLRHPKAASPLSELAEGRFEPVLDDPDAQARPEGVTRVALCSGKVYVDLVTSPRREAAPEVAIVRVEELYPFPGEALAAILARYPEARELVWVQEEPENMGAWSFVAPRLQRLAGGREVAYVGRPAHASPAAGFHHLHEREQARIVAAAFESAPRPSAHAATRKG